MEITRKDFTQIDSRWICVANGLTLMVEADESGSFKLRVMGTLGEIPPATRYPTEPEWETAEIVANEIYRISTLADRRET